MTLGANCRTVVIFSVALCGFASPSMAEVFRSQPLRAGTFTLAAEPELTLSGDEDFTFYLHGGFGISRGYGLHLKVGFGRSPFNDDDVHIGGLVDIPLFRTRGGKFGLFTALGISNWGDLAIENQLILFFALGPLHFYTGLDDAIRFQDNAPGSDVTFPIEWIFGVDVPVRQHVNLLFEGGVELHKSSSYISGGFRLFF